MTVRLPPGVRDYLPQAAARRRGVVAALTRELERWGYRAIITPLYEYDEVLRRGLGAGGPSRMRLVEPQTGEVLSLRPDLTAQVARLVATRLHDEPGPLRLRYEGSVVRVSPTNGQGELFQVGVELIDAPQSGGDLEIVALAEAALRTAGVDGLTLDLGHADVARAALEGLDLDERDEELHAALLRKDQARVAGLLRGLKLPAAQKRLLSSLPALYGGPEVLERARKLVQPRTHAARALDELEALLDRLHALPAHAALTVDLGEVRGFDYYTGTRFSVYAEGVGGALASGGRYDRLVERYGRPARATGFAVDVDRVAELLKARGLPAGEPQGGLLVGGDTVQAGRLARRLRHRGERTVLDLDHPPPADAELKARARRQSLQRVIVVREGGLRWFDVAPPGARGSLAGAALSRLLSAEDAAALDALLPPR